MIKKISDFLAEYLRINAIKRMLTIVDVRWSEILGLVSFAALFAVFEGVGLSLLLPILQYAESGSTAITDSGGPIWTAVASVLSVLSIPIGLPTLLLLAFVPILLRQVVFYLNAWYAAVVSSRIGIRLQLRTLDTVLGADPEFFSRYSVGYLIGVLFSQTGAAGSAILAVIKLISVALLMALYVAILMMLSVPLTLVTLVFAVIVSIVVRVNIRKIREYGMEATDLSQGMMSKIVERLGLMELIILRHQQRQEASRVREFAGIMRRIGIRQARLGAGIEVTADPLLMLSVFVTLYVGISVFDMTLAQLGLLMFVLTRLNAKVKEFNGVRQSISGNMAGLLMVKKVTEAAEAATTIADGPLTFEGLKREIVMDHVSFDFPDTYDPNDKLVSVSKRVLEDVSLRIPAGSFTALVGRSGAGKTTLVWLLSRVQEASTGTITYDGTEIRQFGIGSLRRGIGHLSQTPLLFNASVRENLVYGLDFEPTEEQLRDALERAYASFVLELPNGLETVIGDRGTRFSGGERQRIALARVLLQDSSILILDEPTSSLDSESEGYIQKALHAMHGGKTIIVIAHRLATVIQADQLLVVEDGRIVERGTHSELVELNGSYRRLFETQLLS
ncbi:MAG: ABC transporter ATP-binding protein [Coriobacteriia bacterium]